jgi:hypothetical protein
MYTTIGSLSRKRGNRWCIFNQNSRPGGIFVGIIDVGVAEGDDPKEHAIVNTNNKERKKMICLFIKTSIPIKAIILIIG